MSRVRAERSRAILLVTWGLLAALLIAWFATTLSPPAALTAGLLTIVPLLLPLAGLLRRHRRTYRWAPITLAPALAWSLMELIASPGARAAAVAAALLVFIALAAIVAWLRTDVTTE